MSSPNPPASATLGRLLSALDAAAPVDIVYACERWLVESLGAGGCELLLADYGESLLKTVRNEGVPSWWDHRMEDGPAGEAYRDQHRVQMDLPGQPERVVVFLPVSVRAERIGVLAVALMKAETSHDTVVATLDDVAQVLAYVLCAARRYTDRFEVLRRRRDLNLAAEIQWELLPVLAYELPWLSVAGALEPTYDIGGDTFDYAVGAEHLTVTLTDAVGHGLRAALLGSLAVTAMRNARRCGRQITGQADAANEALIEQFPGVNFVSGLLMQVQFDSGAAVIINAGHPPPLLLRCGEVRTLELHADVPLGLVQNVTYRTQCFQLLPGDRLLLFTDGITEAHHPGKQEFGSDRVTQLLVAQAKLPPVELVRTLTQAVVDYRGGELTDDATAVCLDWWPNR